MNSTVVLLCRVENGKEWIPSFLQHYRTLGVGHMIFLDTGSTDGTLELLQGKDVTVHQTSLPFKTHRLEMRRWLMDLCAPGSWTLNVDMDELFDYPGSDVLDLPSLCAYLDHHGYTAMRAHMLDMFASGPIGSSDAPDDAPLHTQYPWYDLSAVRQLHEPQFFGSKIPAYTGGIRTTVFHRDHFWLTKHPLIKTGCGISAFDQSEHAVTGATIADVTGVLLHYKFTKHFSSYVEESVRRGQHWNESEEYRFYHQELLQHPDLILKRPTAELWRGVEALVDAGFLTASFAYRQYAMGSSTRISGTVSAPAPV